MFSCSRGRFRIFRSRTDQIKSVISIVIILGNIQSRSENICMWKLVNVYREHIACEKLIYITNGMVES